jgi:hypothetical protein
MTIRWLLLLLLVLVLVLVCRIVMYLSSKGAKIANEEATVLCKAASEGNLALACLSLSHTHTFSLLATTT